MVALTRNRSSFRRLLRSSAKWLAWIVAFGFAAAVVAGAIQWATWPNVRSLATESPGTSAFIERYVQQTHQQPAWRPVPYSRISDELKLAVLVTEDIEFFDHEGFSVAEIRFAWQESREEGGRLRGASTITQQLAKNLWLSPSRNPWRKIKEALLTRQLETHLEKRRILELYLNFVDFGEGHFGAEAAARHYFGVAATELDADQAAALAASLANPRRFHPGSSSRAYSRRVARMRARMDRAAWLRKLI